MSRDGAPASLGADLLVRFDFCTPSGAFAGPVMRHAGLLEVLPRVSVIACKTLGVLSCPASCGSRADPSCRRARAPGRPGRARTPGSSWPHPPGRCPCSSDFSTPSVFWSHVRVSCAEPCGPPPLKTSHPHVGGGGLGALEERCLRVLAAASFASFFFTSVRETSFCIIENSGLAWAWFEDHGRRGRARRVVDAPAAW